MKKILASIVLIFLLSGNAFSKVERLPEGTTINSLMKQGYELFSTETIATPTTFGDEDRQYSGTLGVMYHLIKGNEVVSCVLSEAEVKCVKP